jgi:hypothetical protein
MGLTVTRLSTQVELDFPDIEPRTFVGRDVVLKGAEQGDEVQLTEPWLRPAGVEYFAYVREADMVRVCCRNKTEQVLSVPRSTYGIIIEK